MLKSIKVVVLKLLFQMSLATENIQHNLFSMVRFKYMFYCYNPVINILLSFKYTL